MFQRYFNSTGKREANEKQNYTYKFPLPGEWRIWNARNQAGFSPFQSHVKGWNELELISFIKLFLLRSTRILLTWISSPIYTAENFWCGPDGSGTRTQKIVLITHLHVLFSTVLKDVKLWFGTGKRLNISASVLDSRLVRMLHPL